jgi:hypothetical protein
MRTIHIFILAVSIIAAGVAMGLAQTGFYAPDHMPGCIVTTTAAPSYTAGQHVMQSCNTAGQLRVTTTP